MVSVSLVYGDLKGFNHQFKDDRRKLWKVALNRLPHLKFEAFIIRLELDG